MIRSGKTTIECDSCPETFEGEPGELFTNIWAAAMLEGWRMFKIGKEWFQNCPKCGAPS